MIRMPVVAAIASALFVAAPVRAIEPGWQHDIREASRSSIVFIETAGEHENGARARDAGTGFIISPAGHVLTCHHLLPKGDLSKWKLTITGIVGDRVGQPYSLDVIQDDPTNDLLLLKLDSGRQWRPLRTCTTAPVRDDDPIYALGFPFDEKMTGVDGTITTAVAAEDHWRTSAPVNHGMSGGPVFSQKGRVIAMVAGGLENAQKISDLIPLRLAFNLLGVAGADPCPSDAAKVDSRVISAVPNGTDWPASTLGALDQLDRAALTENDTRYLIAIYSKGIDRLYSMLRIPAEKWDSALLQEMENITEVVYRMQLASGFRPDWPDVYAALYEKRPQMLNRLNIPAPEIAEELAPNLEVAPPPADPVAAKISFDLAGPASDLLKKPPLKSLSNAVDAIDFTIHVRTEHDAAVGSVVKVWITPGMAENEAAIEKCRDSDCGGDDPKPQVLQRLFSRALNRALIQNAHGFGQYFVTRCGERAKTKEYGWLDILARVAIGMDPRYSYTIAGYDAGRHRVRTATDYDLDIDQFDDGRSARFVPIRDDVMGIEALEYVWGLCAAQKLNAMVFVTKLKRLEINEKTEAPNMPRF